MTEAGGTYTSRQMTVAGVLVAVLLIAILLWQWTQISQLVSKVDSTAATVASQPWAAYNAMATPKPACPTTSTSRWPGSMAPSCINGCGVRWR